MAVWKFISSLELPVCSVRPHMSFRSHIDFVQSACVCLAEQKVISRLMFHVLAQTNSGAKQLDTLTVHCWKIREEMRVDDPRSYAEATEMKLPTFHTHGCLLDIAQGTAFLLPSLADASHVNRVCGV